jgi:hypothetical protein
VKVTLEFDGFSRTRRRAEKGLVVFQCLSGMKVSVRKKIKTTKEESSPVI